MQNKKIKILRIITRLNIGGPAIHTALLTRELSNNEFESTLMYGSISKGEGDMSYLLKSCNAKLRYEPALRREINLFSDLRVFFNILKYIRKEKPHIVHTHTAKAGFIGRLAAFFAGVPIKIHTFHGHIFYGYFNRFKNKLFLNIERLLAKITDKIIAISSLQEDEIVNKYKITDQTKCLPILLGSELDKFLSIPRESRQKAPIGFREEDIIIGTVGRITEIKNHRFLLEIAREFYDSYAAADPFIAKNVKFVIVGDGELRENINKYIEQLNLKDQVYITGWQKDMVKFYSAFDIFVLTSKNEGTPMSIIEAMASGLPIVATSVGGVPGPELRIMGGGVQNAGFLIDNFDRKDFVHKLRLLVGSGPYSANLRNAHGERARNIAASMFRSDRLVTDIRNLYEKLAQEKGVI